MEIIIRMEEKENPTVGAALREMASDYWVQNYLPQIVESAKKGATRLEVKEVRELTVGTRLLVKESFKQLGIKAECKDLCYSPAYGLHYRTSITFSWN